MEKVFTFSQEQKSLIWSTKVQPNRGTVEESDLFIEVCETYGLNPLLGDIVFKKFETKYGPRVNFIATRDGYVKAAMRDPNYIQCMSNVVREGDHFEFDTVSGEVSHKIKAKRGQIVGAWAIAEHKTRGKYPIFVDFGEHFIANAYSQNGTNKVWDSHPSAMIQKVAEVYALRRQFPLGGIVAEEEVGGIDFENENLPSYGQEQLQPKQPKKQKEVAKEEVKQQEKPPKTSSNKATQKETDTKETQQEKANAEPSLSQKEETAAEQKKAEQKTLEHLGVNPFEEAPQQKEEVNKPENTQPVEEIPTIQNNQDDDFLKVKVVRLDNGIVPTSKEPFVKLIVQQGDKPALVLAKGQEQVEKLNLVNVGDTYLLKYKAENGFNFFEDIKYPEPEQV